MKCIFAIIVIQFVDLSVNGKYGEKSDLKLFALGIS
jgi:hypothetical protein